ncbi:ABC transporter substrate-binding protein [Wenjunlia tyrosinilytica]|uniref:ABC transporter substrate-binding protein n=1 Tax=Wenjunlia tyrosinilytica TaxID=1544741 RepID=UPI0016694BE2|nr:ABC transporter substrate-binding protein [Wenjunlia tyrosinilytica]
MRSAGPGRAAAAAAAVLALVCAVATGCGSRLPESDFTARPSGTPGAVDGNTASDTGVTPDRVKIGIVTSATSPVGGGAFTGPRDGARAFFAALNRAGGVHGRKVDVVTCDDGGSGVGNNQCVHGLIDRDKVFAFTAGSVLDYAGAAYTSAKGVPDVGGQPIGTAYDTYPHLYGIYGSDAPRDGTPGWGGTLYAGTEVYRYFKERLHARTAAVVSYNQADSARYADQVRRGLKREGYRVVDEQVDFALPNFQAVAADLRAKGVDVVFDAMDIHGNSQLCRAMDAAGVRVAAKVTNVQNWSASVPDDYRGSPTCRNSLWATSSSRNYEDTGHPEVRAFRAGMDAYAKAGGQVSGPLSQWQLEGWAAALQLTDAMASCGAHLTRSCVERYLGRDHPYDAHGLLVPTDFVVSPTPPTSRRTCLDVARWEDAKGWVTQAADMDRNCFQVPQLPYRP